MNPSSYDTAEVPRQATVHYKEPRIGEGNSISTEIILAPTVPASSTGIPQNSNRGAPQLKLLCNDKRLPSTNPTKTTMPVHLPHDNKDSMSTASDGSSHKSITTLKSSASDSQPNSLKSMLGLKPRSGSPPSWSSAQKPIGLPTSVSVKSIARQRYARRNSYVSDMVVTARSSCSAAELIHKACLEAQEVANAEPCCSLGYEDAAPKRPQQPQAAEPAPKRRRYQRRNSYYIPETSRSSTEERPAFSFKAMDFLYGQQSAAKLESPTPSVTSAEG